MQQKLCIICEKTCFFGVGAVVKSLNVLDKTETLFPSIRCICRNMYTYSIGNMKRPALHSVLTYSIPFPSIHVRWLSALFSLRIISAPAPDLSTPATPPLKRLTSMPACLASFHSVARSALVFPLCGTSFPALE